MEGNQKVSAMASGWRDKACEILNDSMPWSSINQSIVNVFMACPSQEFTSERLGLLIIALHGIEFAQEDLDAALDAFVEKRVLYDIKRGHPTRRYGVNFKA